MRLVIQRIIRVFKELFDIFAFFFKKNEQNQLKLKIKPQKQFKTSKKGKK